MTFFFEISRQWEIWAKVSWRFSVVSLGFICIGWIVADGGWTGIIERMINEINRLEKELSGKDRARR